MNAHRARRRFGQNFLHDRQVIDRILAAIGAGAGDHVVEIGPGQGALTRGLLDSGCRLTLIEIDRDLAEHIRQDPALSRAELINADALDVDLTRLPHPPLRLVGNLPYNVSTPLLFHALEAAPVLRDLHFMLQKEVVDRMAAGPGGRDYGRLSVMLQYHCRVEPLFVVKPGSFHPVPKVDSAVVRLTPHPNPEPAARDPRLLGRIVTQAFGKRRKTLANALKGTIDAPSLEALGIDPGLRPERLAVADYVAIANQVDP